MSAPASPKARCEVVSGDKLLAGLGGSAALCEAFERAAAERGLDKSVTVQVRVEPRSMFAADVTLADGRKLPTLNMAEMDAPLTGATLDRLGAAIANHVAAARP